MSDTFSDLGWPEATLFDMTFEDGLLRFKMSDLMWHDSHTLKFEIVNVAIPEIEALRIELTPFIHGEYGAKFIAVDFGTVTDEDEVFEGIIRKNPLSDIDAEYFWLTGHVRAKTIEVERTGEIIKTSRKE